MTDEEVKDRLIERLEQEIDDRCPYGWLAFWMLMAFGFGNLMMLSLVAEHLK
jgi:hypothetical protein